MKSEGMLTKGKEQKTDTYHIERRMRSVEP